MYWTGGIGRPMAQPRDDIETELVAVGALVEWSSVNLLSVDAADACPGDRRLLAGANRSRSTDLRDRQIGLTATRFCRPTPPVLVRSRLPVVRASMLIIWRSSPCILNRRVAPQQRTGERIERHGPWSSKPSAVSAQTATTCGAPTLCSAATGAIHS